MELYRHTIWQNTLWCSVWPYYRRGRVQCGELEPEYEQIMNDMAECSVNSNVVQQCSVMSASVGTIECKKCVQCECG